MRPGRGAGYGLFLEELRRRMQADVFLVNRNYRSKFLRGNNHVPEEAEVSGKHDRSIPRPCRGALVIYNNPVVSLVPRFTTG